MDGGFDERHPRRRGARLATVAVVVTLVVAPLVAGAVSTGTPVALLGLPVESVVVLLILSALPGPRLRALVAGAFGALIVLAMLTAALDLGFTVTVDRAFSLAEDVPAVFSALGVVGEATGTTNLMVILVLLAVLLAGAAVALARAALRTHRLTSDSGRTGRIALTAVAASWILCALTGAQLLPGVPFAVSPSTAALVATSESTAQSLRDQEDFERTLTSDPLRGASADLLAALEGKDVVFTFVESYGRVALEDAPFTAGVAEVLREGGAQLTRDGYSAQSAFLTSPTFGGVSWLAHSTLQSGVWVTSQQKYDRLMSTERLTLTRVFADAGWRTVAVVPSNTKLWPPGSSFYGYDAMLDAQNMGYAGPAFSYARVPDQYTFKVFHDRELAGAREPVMAEVDLVSSHTPWTPLPRLVPWAEIGDGSVFDAHAAEGPAPIEVWSDPGRVREWYGRSVEYSLGAMFSYLHAYDQPDLVLVVLGDHQPARIVSGPDADRDVPVTIISKDPAVFERIASWRWERGVHPSPDAAVWRMDQFRDRFVDAFTR